MLVAPRHDALLLSVVYRDALLLFPPASVVSVVSVRDLLSAEKSTVPVRIVFPSFLFVSA